jgi:hypothetical protein
VRLPGILRPVLAALLTVGLLSLTPLAAPSAAAADCRAIPLVPFGTAPTPSGGVPNEDDKWCALVTTTAAGAYIVNGSSQVFGPGGDWVQPEYTIDIFGYQVFQLDAGTTYRLELNSSDLVAVHDGLSGGGCPTLADTSWAAPRDVESFGGGRLVCRQFTAPGPDAVIRLNTSLSDYPYEELLVLDGDGDTVCNWRAGVHIECALDEGPGPYRLVVGGRVGTQADVSVVDTASTAGCQVIGPMAWSQALPTYERGTGGRRWECFAYQAGSTGTHIMSTMELDPQWEAQFELWRVGDGELGDSTSGATAPSSAGFPLTAGESYRFVISGNPREHDQTYRFGMFDTEGGAGCGTAVGTSWNAAPMSGTVAGGSIDCYAFDADPGEKYRTQIEGLALPDGVSGTVVNARCSHSRVCQIGAAGPHRLLVSQNGWQDVVTPRAYRAYFTEVDSGGCQQVPLAAWNQALPIVAQADNAAYHCYSLTTGPGRYHRLSTWSESEQWTPTWELWEAGTVDQTAEFSRETGLPSVDGDVFVEPSSAYRLVVSGDVADASGEYRAGLFDVARSTGCPVIPDLSWSAPPIVGEVTKGALDCRQLPATVTTDDVVSVGDVGSRVTDANGSECSYSLCEIDGVGPWRMVTYGDRESGAYRFYVNDPSDLTGCANATASLAFEAPPVTATLAPGERACYEVDLDSSAVEALFSVEVGGSNGMVGGLASLVPASGRGCSLDSEETCDVQAGRHALVLDNTADVTNDLAVLLRTATSSTTSCEGLTSTRVSGALEGHYDERCFTFTPPAGTVFSVRTDAGAGGAAPTARVFGGAWCDLSPVYGCLADGSQVVLSVVNRSDIAGQFAMAIEPVPAYFVNQPLLTGRPVVGAVLKLGGGWTSPAGASWTVAWLRDGVVVGSGRSYRLTPADAGHRVRPRLTVRRDGYADSVVTQPGVRVQKGTIEYAASYAISGRPLVGQTLRAPVARSKVRPAGVAVRYQWFRGATAIRGATSATYRLTAADRGRPVTCRAVLKKSGYVDRRLRTGPVRVR